MPQTNTTNSGRVIEFPSEETTRALTTPTNSSSNSSSSSSTPPTCVHVKLKLKGTPEQIAMFHSLCKFRDSDWPYSRLLGRRNSEVAECPKCKGLTYSRPTMAPADIKAAAKQVGLRSVRIQHFAKPCALSPIEVAALCMTNSMILDDEGYN